MVELADIEAAYRDHVHHVLRRAAVVLGNDSDARDVVQEVFLSLLHRPEQFAARSSLTTWLYSATLHSCLNRLRNQRNRSRLVEANPEALPRPGHLASAEHRADLRALLIRLPDTLAEVAVYHFVDEMTQDEIAEVMACSRRQVRHLLGRLRRVLDGERSAAW